MFRLPVVSSLFNYARTDDQDVGKHQRNVTGDTYNADILHGAIVGGKNNVNTIYNTETEGPAVASGGVFYAYIHSRVDDNTSRMIIIFASRKVADEWWRAVSTDKSSKLQGNIQRITPQFYNHDASRWNFINFFIDPDLKPISDKFRGKMFIVMENDRSGRGITVIPLQCIVDHASGSSYCIRSLADHQQHWDVDQEGRVFVSDEGRTSFVVTAKVSKKSIMIGADEITLSTPRGVVLLQKPSNFVTFSFVITSTTAEKGHGFKLEDLEGGRFFVDGSGLVCFSDVDKCGSAWELAM